VNKRKKNVEPNRKSPTTDRPKQGNLKPIRTEKSPLTDSNSKIKTKPKKAPKNRTKTKPRTTPKTKDQNHQKTPPKTQEEPPLKSA